MMDKGSIFKLNMCGINNIQRHVINDELTKEWNSPATKIQVADNHYYYRVENVEVMEKIFKFNPHNIIEIRTWVI